MTKFFYGYGDKLCILYVFITVQKINSKCIINLNETETIKLLEKNIEVCDLELGSDFLDKSTNDKRENR